MVDITEVNTDDDINDVVQLAYISWNESYRDILSQEQIDFMLNTIQSANAISNDINTGCRYFLLSANNEHCGYVAVRPEVDRLFLSKIYILKRYQRMGLASQVIRFLRQMCSDAGARSIYLTVNRNNKDAVTFYERIGFIIVGDKVAEIGGGFVMDDHVMELLVR